MTAPRPHAIHGGDSFAAIGSDFADLDRRHGVVDADVLDAWYPPAPGVLAVVREHLPWLMKTSPPTHGDGLRAAIAVRHGLDPAQVLVGGGTSSLMFLALPRLVAAGDRVAILDPMYGEYAHVCEVLLGARLVRCPLDPDAGFVPDPARIAATARDCRLLVLVNPNSPTGRVLGREGLAELLDRLPEGCRVWIDETYVDFVPDVPTLEPVVARDRRVIVAKSLSKFFSLSGLRVGYLAADHELAAALEPWNPPWSAGLLAQVAAVQALREYGWYRERAAETAVLRDELAADLAAIPGLHPVPRSANFLMLRSDRVSAAALVARCRAAGVFLRDCGSLGQSMRERYVRTAVKDRAGNQRIAAALRAASA